MMIFLYGEDAFRSRRKMLEIKNKFLSADKSGSGLSVFDCEEDKEAVKKIIGTLATPDLFAPKRLIVVKNLIESFPKEEQEKFLNFLKKAKDQLNGSSDVLVIWEKEQPKKSESLYKFLIKNAKSQAFEKLTGAKFSQWILKTLKEIDGKASISKQALDKLILYAGNDSYLIYNELSKLANYAGGKLISEKDVEMLVKANLEGDIFAMVDALGKNNKKEALRLLHTHLEKGDDPFYLLSMFFYQFRNMLKVMDLYEEGLRSEYEIAKVAKLHPFVVKKSLAQSARFPFSLLKKIYDKLSQLDTGIKTGKIEIKLALDKFIAEL